MKPPGTPPPRHTLQNHSAWDPTDWLTQQLDGFRGPIHIHHRPERGALDQHVFAQQEGAASVDLGEEPASAVHPEADHISCTDEALREQRCPRGALLLQVRAHEGRQAGSGHLGRVQAREAHSEAAAPATLVPQHPQRYTLTGPHGPLAEHDAIVERGAPARCAPQVIQMHLRARGVPVETQGLSGHLDVCGAERGAC